MGKVKENWTIDPVHFLRRKNLFFFIFFSLGWGGGFRDKKKFFFENGIYVTKIPTKSIFDFGKR